MNESAYHKALWKRMSKVGDSGMKILNTGWLDSAFGGADARKKLMLQRIGDQRQVSNRRLDLAETAQNNRNDYLTGTLGLRQGYQDLNSKDALTGDLITLAGMPVSYLEGKNEAESIDENTERQKKINTGYRGLIGGYS